MLDVDPRSGGAESLAALRERVALPPTLTARTGSGGLHLIYRHPGRPLAGRTHALGPGLDVKADGGYVVAAPSVHPDTGRAYVWANPGTEIAPWPVVLDALIERNRSGARPVPRPDGGRAPVAVSALCAWVSRQAEGGRNAALFWAACRAAESGVGNLAPLVRAGVRAGLDVHEAARTVASAERLAGGGA